MSRLMILFRLFFTTKHVTLFLAIIFLRSYLFYRKDMKKGFADTIIEQLDKELNYALG